MDYATLFLSCYDNSSWGGRSSPSTFIGWGRYVYISTFDDISVFLSWDDGPIESYQWDAAASDGNAVSPPRGASEEDFIQTLALHNTLNVQAIGFDGEFYRAEFDLIGSERAIGWVEAACTTPS